MLLPDQPPNHRHVLDDHVDRDGAQRAQHARQELDHAEPVQREALDHPEHVHVDVEPGDERAQKVHQVRARNRVQPREDHIRRRQGHRDPRVHADPQQQLVAQRDRLRVDHQQDALEPAFALLQKVEQRERALLVHFALDEVEGVPGGERTHREEAVLRDRAVDAVVERDLLLGVDLRIG